MLAEKCLRIIQESFDSLKTSGIIKVDIQINQNTVLLGKGSPLDSLGFVTLMTEMEDRLSRISGKDIFFVINDISNFNINNPFLSAESFANYMSSLIVE